MEKMGYTAKEINSIASLSTYTAIVMCHPDQLQDVRVVWSQLFDNVDVLFAISDDFHNPGIAFIDMTY